MVFEAEADIRAFRMACNERRIEIRNRLISLDGGSYNARPVSEGGV